MMDVAAAAAEFQADLLKQAGGINLYIKEMRIEGTAARFLLPQNASILVEAKHLEEYFSAPETQKREILNNWISRFCMAFIGPAAHTSFSDR